MSKAISPTGLVVARGRSARIVRSVKGACTWCGVLVAPPRRTWCSQECVDAFNWTQPGVQRSRIGQRDRGVCAACGLDTERLLRLQWRFIRLWERWHPDERRSAADRAFWEAVGLSPPDMHRDTLWDLEHRVAIADGGDPFDPANLQSMCSWCHKKKTAREAAERARRRRAEKQPELFAQEDA